MSAPLCPACNRPLAPSVVNGPAQAVVRCEGCQTLLLWSNGRVMRSAKSSTPTMMGMQAVTGKPAARDADAPLPELRPEGDAPPAKPPTRPRATTPATGPRPAPARPTMMGIGENVPTRVAPPTPELRKEATRKDAAPAPVKNAPSGPIKTAPSAAMKNAPSGPIKTAAVPSVPAKTAPSGPIKTGAVPSAPVKTAPSGPTKLPPPATPAKPPASAKADADKSESPHVVAAVAQVPKMAGGDMVDPSAWFQGDVSDVVPPEKVPAVQSARAPHGETTGAQPLPPPPELPSLPPLEVEPFEIEAPSDKTPPIGTRIPDLDSAPIAVSAREPSQKIAAREPSSKVPTAPPPPSKKSASAVRGADPQVPAPARAVAEPPSAGPSSAKPPDISPRATVMGRPALDVPPKPAEPVAAIDLLPPATTSASSSSAAATSAPSPAMPAAAPMSPPIVEPAVATDVPLPATTPAAAAATSQTLLPAQPETTRVPRAISRRTLFIVGGAASGVILLVVMVMALAHGGKAPPAKPIVPLPPVGTAPTPPPAPTPPAPAPTTPAPTPTAAPPEPEPTEAAAPTPPRPRRTLGGKKVVLEYDPKPTSPTPPPAQAPTPMGEDPATVARAREAYHNGNVKLFAGDDDGAIALYRESLKIYPGYVAGYRGLGLAFEEAGRKSDALTAFHTYVRTVPNAVDAAIIRRRIEHLESEK